MQIEVFFIHRKFGYWRDQEKFSDRPNNYIMCERLGNFWSLHRIYIAFSNVVFSRAMNKIELKMKQLALTRKSNFECSFWCWMLNVAPLETLNSIKFFGMQFSCSRRIFSHWFFLLKSFRVNLNSRWLIKKFLLTLCV